MANLDLAVSTNTIYTEKHSYREFPYPAIQSFMTIANTSDKEICGVIRNEEFLELENLSGDPGNILIDSKKILEEDTLIHSHYLDTQPGFLSETDVNTAKLTDTPCLMYHTVFRTWDYYNSRYVHPYPFKLRSDRLSIADYAMCPKFPVRCDCYSLVRDILRGIWKVEIPDVYRNSVNQNRLYTLFRNPESVGFKRSYQRIPGNLILMYLSEEIPYHLGLIVNNDHAIHVLNYQSELISIEAYLPQIIGIYTWAG
jgi:hypothetical protein